jgi:Zinc-binding dehydrogenase
MQATAQHGADLIVNAVGGSVFAENLRALAFEGRLATVGYVDGVLHADIDLETLHVRRLTVFGVSNKLRSKAQRAAALPGFVSDVLPHLAAGRIRVLIDHVYEFDQLEQAKSRMEAAGHVGKIILSAQPFTRLRVRKLFNLKIDRTSSPTRRRTPTTTGYAQRVLHLRPAGGCREVRRDLQGLCADPESRAASRSTTRSPR